MAKVRPRIRLKKTDGIDDINRALDALQQSIVDVETSTQSLVAKPTTLISIVRPGANVQATAGTWFLLSPSTTPITVKAPASPTQGDSFGIKIVGQTSGSVYITANGSRIENPSALGTYTTSSLNISTIGAQQWYWMGLGNEQAWFSLNAQTSGSTTTITGSTVTGSGGGADPGASYVVMGLTSSLANERVLTAGTNISITDGGANGAATVALASSITAQTSYSIVPSPNNVSGTHETLVGSININPTVSFTSALALLGSEFSGDRSTLRMRRQDTGDIVLTLTGVGLMANVPSTGSVVIPATGWYNVSIFNSSPSGSVVCQGFKLVV